MNGAEQMVLIGIDFNSAGELLRAKHHLSQGQIETIYRDHSGPGEVLILSTCNRTEFYFNGLNRPEQAWDFLGSVFEGVRLDRENFYSCQGERVWLHLLQLAVGLKSMLIGETEILGQIRAAWRVQIESTLRAGELGEGFRKVLSYARRIRHQTHIGGHSASLTTLVIKELRRYVADFNTAAVLILGNGALGQKMAQAFLYHNVPVTILTRGPGAKRRPKPQQVVAGARMIFGHDQLDVLLPSHSIVVAATGAPHYVLKKEHADILQGKFLLDLAFPRNIDPALADDARGRMWDLDYFEKISEANRQSKAAAIAAAGRQCIAAAEQIGEALYGSKNTDWNQQYPPFAAITTTTA